MAAEEVDLPPLPFLPSAEERIKMVRWGTEIALAERERARWQPIETAPKDGTNVLLVNRKGNMATGLWQGSGSQEGWWLRGGNRPNVFFNDHHGPTHWMPLPKPPTP